MAVGDSSSSSTMRSAPTFVTPVGLPLSSLSTSTASSVTSPRRHHRRHRRSRVALVPSATVATPVSNPAPIPNPNSDSTSSGVVDIASPEQFDTLLANTDGLVCVDFMARWCRKCKYLLPRLRKLARAHARNNVTFCTVDVNAVARLPKQFNITKMPTFVLLRNGTVVHSFIGGASPEQVAQQLEAIVNKYATDMDMDMDMDSTTRTSQTTDS